MNHIPMHGETSMQDRPGLLARTLDWIKARLARSEELGRLSRGDLAAMASDLGLSEADLRDVLPRAADNSGLMDRMLQARGLDPVSVRQGLAALERDLERVCTLCNATGRCKRELDAGTAAAHCHEFCENADTLDDLIEIRAAA